MKLAYILNTHAGSVKVCHGFSKNSEVCVYRARLYAVFFQALVNLKCIIKMTRWSVKGFIFFVPTPPPHNPPRSSKPHFESNNREEGDEQK